MNRRRLCLRLFARAQRSSAEGTPPGFRQILTVPPSSSFFTFSGTLFAWWGPKRIEQAQALPAAVRASAAKLCLVVARLRTRRVSPFSETRSPAAAPPLPKKSLRVQIFFGSPFIPKGNGRYLPSPPSLSFLPFQVPFLRGGGPKELNRRRLCLRLFARAQRSSASSSHAFAHDAFRLSPKRVLPRRLLLFPKNLCVCKSFSGALLSRRETADTYRPPLLCLFYLFRYPFCVVRTREN